eukprot:5788201-Pyramimonas_sp.AAC.1
MRKFEHETRFVSVRRGLRRPVCVVLFGVLLGIGSIVGLLLGLRAGSPQYSPTTSSPNEVSPNRLKGKSVIQQPGLQGRDPTEENPVEDIATARVSSELVGGLRSCPKNCSGHGICNRVFGECRCTIGWKGDGCSLRDLRRCNEKPDQKSASLCDGDCDDERGLCYCNGTHPHRPLPMQ